MVMEFANVPEYYETNMDVRLWRTSRNIIDLVKQPNKFSAMIAGICLVSLSLLLLPVVFLIRRIIRKIRVRKGKRKF